MKKRPQSLEQEGKRHLKIGVGLGVLSVGAIATFGAIACPLCVVACPAFVASGAVKLKRARQNESTETESRSEP